MTYKVMTADVVRAEIEEYEEKHGISSSEFLKRFWAGEFDEPDAISWEWMCELADEMGIPRS